MAAWICLQFEKGALDLMDYQDAYYTKLDRIKASTYEKISKSILTRRYVFLLNMVFLQLLFFFFWPIFGYEDEYYFPVFFFNEYIKPIFGRYIVYALRISFYIATYTYVSSAGIQVHFILYFFSHMQFQLIIVEDNIRDMEKIDGRIQQRFINDNLKACIKHYMCIKK